MKSKWIFLLVLTLALLLLSCNFVSDIFSGKPDSYFFIWAEEGTGVMDCNGEWILEPQDDYMLRWQMVDGLAPYFDLKNNVYGYLNTEGEPAFDKDFDQAQPFSDGLAAVLVDNKWGFIDSSGEYAIRPKFKTNQIGTFSDGLVNVPDEMDSEGRYAISSIFIDKEGNQALGPYRWASSFQNGYAAVAEQRGEGFEDLYSGFINTDGEFVIEFDFEDKLSAVRLSAGEGLFGVHDLDQEITEGICSTGFMNIDQEWVIDPQFCDVGAFSDGLAPVTIRDDDGAAFYWGYIDTDGNFVVDAEYDFVTPFANGCAVVMWDQFNNSGLINTDGEFVYKYER